MQMQLHLHLQHVHHQQQQQQQHHRPYSYSPPPLLVPNNTPSPSLPPTTTGTPTSPTSSSSCLLWKPPPTSAPAPDMPPTSAPQTQIPPADDDDDNNNNTPPPTLHSLAAYLLPKTALAHPPSHPYSQALTPKIAALSLHPTLEAALHLLNADLPSAHFLVRHMASPPAVEGMLLHAILHRVEGDVANARAWLRDVGDAVEGWVPKRRGVERLEREVGSEGDVLGFVYGGEGEGRGIEILERVERFRKGGAAAADNDDEKEIEERTREELRRVIEWCTDKFGDGPWVDARSAYAGPGDEVRKIGEDMVTGSKGWRDF